MTAPEIPRSPLDSIPQPGVIRERLTQLFAEARLLRALLRLAETKSRNAPRLQLSDAEREEVHHVR